MGGWADEGGGRREFQIPWRIQILQSSSELRKANLQQSKAFKQMKALLVKDTLLAYPDQSMIESKSVVALVSRWKVWFDRAYCDATG